MNKYIFQCSATGTFIQIEKYVNQKYFDQKYINIRRIDTTTIMYIIN